ncbi:unnamed protein product, partial [Mesorhabditis spiculigera]
MAVRLEESLPADNLQGIIVGALLCLHVDYSDVVEASLKLPDHGSDGTLSDDGTEQGEIIDPLLHADLYEEQKQEEEEAKKQELLSQQSTPTRKMTEIPGRLPEGFCPSTSNCYTYSALLLGRQFLLSGIKGLKNDRELNLKHPLPPSDKLDMYLVRSINEFTLFAAFLNRFEFLDVYVRRHVGWLRADLLSKGFINKLIALYPNFNSLPTKCAILNVMCELPRDGVQYALADPKGKLFDVVQTQIEDMFSTHTNMIQETFLYLTVLARTGYIEWNRVEDIVEQVLDRTPRQAARNALSALDVLVCENLIAQKKAGTHLWRIWLQRAAQFMEWDPEGSSVVWTIFLHGARRDEQSGIFDVIWKATTEAKEHDVELEELIIFMLQSMSYCLRSEKLPKFSSCLRFHTTTEPSINPKFKGHTFNITILLLVDLIQTESLSNSHLAKLFDPAAAVNLPLLLVTIAERKMVDIFVSALNDESFELFLSTVAVGAKESLNIKDKSQRKHFFTVAIQAAEECAIGRAAEPEDQRKCLANAQELIDTLEDFIAQDPEIALQFYAKMQPVLLTTSLNVSDLTEGTVHDLLKWIWANMPTGPIELLGEFLAGVSVDSDNYRYTSELFDIVQHISRLYRTQKIPSRKPGMKKLEEVVRVMFRHPLLHSMAMVPETAMNNYDVLTDFAWRVNWLGWTTRQQFEDSWMSLFGVLSSTPTGSELTQENATQYTEQILSSAKSVEALTELLLSSLLYPEPGNSICSHFVVKHRERTETYRSKSIRQLTSIKARLLGDKDPSTVFQRNIERLIPEVGWNPRLKASVSEYLLRMNCELDTASSPRIRIPVVAATFCDCTIDGTLSDLFDDSTSYLLLYEQMRNIYNSRILQHHPDFGYVIYSILKAVTVLGVEPLESKLSELDFGKHLLGFVEMGLTSHYAVVREHTLHGVLYFLQSMAGESMRPIIQYKLCEALLVANLPHWTLELITAGIETLIFHSTAFSEQFAAVARESFQDYHFHTGKFPYALRIFVDCIFREEADPSRNSAHKFQPLLQTAIGLIHRCYPADALLLAKVFPPILRRLYKDHKALEIILDMLFPDQKIHLPENAHAVFVIILSYVNPPPQNTLPPPPTTTAKGGQEEMSIVEITVTDEAVIENEYSSTSTMFMRPFSPAPAPMMPMPPGFAADM